MQRRLSMQWDGALVYVSVVATSLSRVVHGVGQRGVTSKRIGGAERAAQGEEARAYIATFYRV